MSKKEKGKKPDNVVAITRCKSHDCGQRDQRAGFCNEHFLWFKEGLITKDGEKVKDFDKKWQHYKARAA